MNILITGWAGFIGSHLVDACFTKWHKVCVVDNLATGNLANIQPHIDSWVISFYQADIRDTDSLSHIFQVFHPEVVFHEAAQINVRYSIDDPGYTADVNIRGTINILDAMKSVDCRRIIFASTGGAMFSSGELPYSEEQTPTPNTPYGISKLSWEQMIHFYAGKYGFETTILRYANVYWPRQDPRWEAGIVTIFHDKIQKKEIPVIFGDGEQTRDFVHVSDVVSANIHVLEHDISGLFHVGTGRETSVNALWQIFQQNFHTDVEPEYWPPVIEPRRSALDISLLESTGWKCRTNLEEGIKTLM